MNRIHSLLAIALFLWNCACPASAAEAEKREKGSETPRKPAEWKAIFNGENLDGWEITDFAGHGPVKVEEGKMVLGAGITLTGATYTNFNKLPRMDYEIRLEAKKVDGYDFFCGLTFPVRDASCTFIVGGWGGGVVGISSLDGMDASENETASYQKFETGRWYKIKVRVTNNQLEAWIDDKKVVDADTEGRHIGMRPGEIEKNVPFGLASYQTTAELKNVQIRRLKQS